MSSKIWTEAVKNVAANGVAVLDRLKDVAVTFELLPSVLPQRLLVKVGEGEALAEVIDGLSQYQARHLRAGKSSIVQIMYEGDGSVNAELLALVGREIGLAAGCPVVTVPENGRWLVLHDSNDRVRVGTVINEKPDGYEPEFQNMQMRLRGGMYQAQKDIPVHPEDQRYADEKAGISAPVRLTLRELLEKVLSEKPQ